MSSVRGSNLLVGSYKLVSKYQHQGCSFSIFGAAQGAYFENYLVMCQPIKNGTPIYQFSSVTINDHCIWQNDVHTCCSLLVLKKLRTIIIIMIIEKHWTRSKKFASEHCRFPATKEKRKKGIVMLNNDWSALLSYAFFFINKDMRVRWVLSCWAHHGDGGTNWSIVDLFDQHAVRISLPYASCFDSL